MKLALIAYARLTAGKQADHHTQLAQAYERGRQAAREE